MPSADFCAAITGLANPLSPGLPDTAQTSRGKIDRLHRTPAGFTTPALDGYGLRDHLLARPAGQASYPVLVHRVAALLHASFRPRLATTPLRFANPSPPSGWIEDLHLQAVDHARHTIGIGGSLAAPPLPHHRAYGSVHGGSTDLGDRAAFDRSKAEPGEEGVRHRVGERGTVADPPWAMRAAGSTHRQALSDPEAA